MPRCLSVSASVFAFLLIQINGSPASAQQASGRTVGVIPDASALRSEGRSPLAVQQPVYMGDSIQTGPSGEAQIDFVDNTRLVVGPASSLLIDNSVLRNRRTMSSFVVSALRGTFRFISGSSPKPAYAIHTPTATIGVRGTEFDFAVLPDGSTEFVLFHGSAQVCDRSGACTVVRGACDAIVGSAQRPHPLARATGRIGTPACGRISPMCERATPACGLNSGRMCEPAGTSRHRLPIRIRRIALLRRQPARRQRRRGPAPRGAVVASLAPGALPT